MHCNLCTNIVSSIIPISDNGGSSSELIRFFGGPGIGDVRSEYHVPASLETCYKLRWISRFLWKLIDFVGLFD
jgi:hypothetical protein